MRKMNRALNVLKDHVAAVMDVEFSPTGEELVSASYDRTIRLWNRQQGHSRDIYHTKRMQRVFSCQWTPDSKYLRMDLPLLFIPSFLTSHSLRLRRRQHPSLALASLETRRYKIHQAASSP